MKEGQRIRVKVIAVHDYGIDLEAEGRRGFVQPIEISWNVRDTPAEVARVGEDIDVVVYAMTADRFFASIKEAHPELDPWHDPSRFAVGTVHDALVVDVTDWGFKVAIAEGVHAMLLDSSVPRPYRAGERLTVEVESADAAHRKLAVRVWTVGK